MTTTRKIAIAPETVGIWVYALLGLFLIACVVFGKPIGQHQIYDRCEALGQTVEPR